ncbi:L-aspartate oxidase [Jatrophihabitans telluris]|uniref:L-aspartate oxidase n=1 Tax=Jatrophihabitans telluris TaxID=2038343 RepID=A0ABY4QZ86_9ACTN|nr:L-aspartate oxidase [Jatrophihabitans telluris]UQX88923.1 L-aspartate oxidase [Jatrophihabitans telluris]
MSLPQKLLAPAPGWIVETDVVIVGSGVAGLTTALRIAGAGLPGAVPTGLRVMVVTKDVLAAGSTRWAQGGIAAALGPDDTPADHLADTLVAGVGLCERDAVQVLVDEGPAAVRELVQLGTRFDLSGNGELSLTREGGHHRDRIAHAGGDATGAEIERALVAAVLASDAIEVIEHALVLDLLPTSAGVGGVTLHVMGEGQLDGVGAVRARAVVLATGGMGQIYAATTNPSVSTGDGVAAALRAGAVVRDLEFVQFHPTVLWLGGGAAGQQPLVSEAVRGEGAFLVDDAGRRFMQGQHELADLAPRDVVAKAILREMAETGAAHVWLDARHFGAEKWRVRFPTILATLNSLGIDPVAELIPVAPACHYASGGIGTDLHGRASVTGLYACGEAACTGVHGANRLASNSLLEGLVFGRRIADDVIATLSPGDPLVDLGVDVRSAGICSSTIRPLLQREMSADAGVLRDAPGLVRASATLAKLSAQRSRDPRTESWEATNLLTVATALVVAATRRQETRGSHWREDHPGADDERWLGHLDLSLGPDGMISSDYRPLRAPGAEPSVPSSELLPR